MKNLTRIGEGHAFSYNFNVWLQKWQHFEDLWIHKSSEWSTDPISLYPLHQPQKILRYFQATKSQDFISVHNYKIKINNGEQ